MKRLVHVLIIAAVTLLAVSCADKSIGFAVILWPAPDSGLQENAIYPIIGESEIQEGLNLRVDDTEQSVAAWRVMRFDEEAAALTFQSDFEAWAATYARSLRTALPVRERADRTTTRVYRLRENEVVKIIDRQDEPSDEAGLVDYWYQVLTREGITGWAFGYHLELTGASGQALSTDDSSDDAVQLLEDIADVAWRPQYFDEMIQSGRLVLSEFGPRFGLFGDIENQRFRLVLPGVDRTFEYEGFSMPNRSVVEFEGTNLSLTLSGDRELIARYTVAGRDRTTTLVRIEEDLQDILAAEQERREQQLSQILSRGTGLVSATYGSMDVGERGTISKHGFERLVPTVLPSDFDGTASMEFSLFLADELRGRYDGALQMQVGSGRRRAFLYTLVDDGLRLVYVPENLIGDDNVVVEEPISPVVMFYRFVNS